MNDEAALLAAILAQPDEDTPRLVFADWLDENGHPERAEFIRVQIEVTRLPDAERPTPHYRARLIRFRQLVAAHATSWSEALGVPSTRALFRRGFIEEVTFTPDEIPTATNPALFREPLRTVTITQLTHVWASRVPGTPVLRKLASWPGAGRFHTLHLSGLNIPAAALGPFFAAPAVANLCVLDATGCLSAEGVVALAESPHLTRLEHLGLGSVQLSVEQAIALLRTPNLKNLRRLDLIIPATTTDADDAVLDPMDAVVDALQARYGSGVRRTQW